LDLLDWLAERRLDITDLTQPDLEAWLAGGGAHRLDVRYFLNWLHSRGLAAKLHVPLRRTGDPVIHMTRTKDGRSFAPA
jgi:hypothetical protein